MYFRYSIFLIALLLNAIAFAQPVPPSVGYPLALTRGGTEISNVMTSVATSGAINALAIDTGNLVFTTSSGVTLHGIVAPSPVRNISIWIYNTSSSSFALVNNSASASAANRLRTPLSITYYLPIGSGVSLFYSTATNTWSVSDDTSSYTSPLTRSIAGAVSMPEATSGVSGYLSSTFYNTIVAGLKWASRIDDLYNLNTGNVWIALYPCSELVTYSTCGTYTECTIVNAGDCTLLMDESSCNAAGGASQCSWDGMACSGSGYFTSCTGSYHRDDTSFAKVQIRPTSSCVGTATACSTWSNSSGEAACNAQDGCGPFVADTCSAQGDQSACEEALCSWGGANCSGDNSIPNTCSSYTDSTSCDGAPPCYSNMTGDCTSASNTDEATCLALNANGGDCSYSDPDCTGTGYFVGCDGDNGTPSTCGEQGDQSSCEGAACTWNPDFCSGDNSSCPGTATACNTFDNSGTCAAQAGCSYTLTPALRAQGDIITTTELSVGGVTGSQKVVCVKSDGNFGVCSGSYSSGSCTCS